MALGLCLFPGVITIIIGVALAIFVLIDTAREGRDHGKAMAIGALCAAGAWVVAFSAIGIYFLTAGVERDPEGDLLESGRVSTDDLTVGDCLPDPPRDGNQFFVDVVPCAEPHRGEVFAVFEVRRYSSPDEESSEIDAGCIEGYKANVGAAPMDPIFEVFVLQPPDRRSFDKKPVVSCLGYVAEPVTGRLKDKVG